jgi:predicted dehydrogenase
MIQAAVIGAGNIAKQHLAALAKLDYVEVVGLCDLSPILAEATADRFGVPAWFSDYRDLLVETRPDVVHIVTPAPTHFAIARDSLESGAHVFIEKPITSDLEELEELFEIAAANRRWVLEDHNYEFNTGIQRMLARLRSGDLGQVRHVSVQLNLAIFGPGSRYADPELPHPAMQEPLGPASDFLTHLCYLAHIFIGPHRSVQAMRISDSLDGLPGSVDLQVLVAGRHATATLGFSADSQPDSFVVRVEGTRMQMDTNLFEVGVLESRVLSGPKPLQPIRNALARSRAERRNAMASLRRKLGGGPGAYEGLWELVRQIYLRLDEQAPPPISLQQIRDVNRLVHAVNDGVTSSCAC